jgi:hypothetical protein
MTPNNKRMTVDPHGKWQLYTQTLPNGATPLGTVTICAETGALVRIEENGRYAMVNAGAVRLLDGRSVAAALGTSGRPQKMSGGRRADVYLDAASLAAAERLGDGNVSEGIRRALKTIDNSKEK